MHLIYIVLVYTIWYFCSQILQKWKTKNKNKLHHSTLVHTVHCIVDLFSHYFFMIYIRNSARQVFLCIWQISPCPKHSKVTQMAYAHINFKHQPMLPCALLRVDQWKNAAQQISGSILVSTRDQLIFIINIFIIFLVVLKAGLMTKPIVCPIPFVSTGGVDWLRAWQYCWRSWAPFYFLNTPPLLAGWPQRAFSK